MRLLVSCIPYDKGKSGISVYVREVVRELALQGHDLTLLCEDGSVVKQLGGYVVPNTFNHDTTEPQNHETAKPPNHQAAEPQNHKTILAPGWTRRPAFSMLWHLFVLPFWIRRHRKEFDGFVICAANRRVCASYPLPTTATVHDLANFHVPGKYSRLRMFYLASILPHFAKKAQRLVAVSGATRADMVKFWHCREDDVAVLYNGLAERHQASGGNEGRGAGILYISRIEHPGKNHVRLIEAYGRLPREIAAAHPLVIAGADWKDAEKVHAAAAGSPHSDFIRFTGFVAAEDMEKLWSEAGFYVFPSLFEGFGLSLVEAMERGIPCACSNNGSLGEIAGDVAVTFDPESVDEIASSLSRLLGEGEADRAARISRGIEHVKKFSWADHAKGIAGLIESAMGHATSDDRRGLCLASSVDAANIASNAPCPGTSLLFGIPVARVTESEAVERIVAMAKARRSQIPDAVSPFFVATLNVDFVTNAVKGWPFGGNVELWGYLKRADLVTADGMPIVLLSRLLGCRLPERVTGADMVPEICRRFAEEGLSVYVLGGDKVAVEEAFAKLGGNQTIKLVGHDDSFVRLDEDQPEIVERINAAKTDLLFVALGNPKQELWMGRNAAKLRVPVMIGVGGTFNFIAGRVKRAPKWMQKSGLEWVYRIIQEPGRLWRRYAYGLVKFSWLSLRAVLGRGG